MNILNSEWSDNQNQFVPGFYLFIFVVVKRERPTKTALTNTSQLFGVCVTWNLTKVSSNLESGTAPAFLSIMTAQQWPGGRSSFLDEA